MRIFSGLPLLLLVAATASGSAQTTASAPGGTLRGVVQDSATGEPVPYALVVLVGKDRQAFTTESGRFSLTNLGAGRARLRVQQIGYRAHTVTLDLETRSATAGGAPGVVVRLVRQAMVLPELSVEAKNCLGMRDVGSTAPEGGTLLNAAYLNAERIRTLERKYPFVLVFQRLVTHLDSEYTRIDGRVDTLEKDSRTYLPYRAGKVLTRGRRERLVTFTSSDVAGEEFQKAHCFWYAGRDSVEGFSAYRIDFAPRPEVTTPDWAGSMLVDSASLTLLRTETRLVNLPRTGTAVLAANCTVFYQPIVPSLPQEFQTRCMTSRRGGSPRIQEERWLLINRRFLGKTPIEPDQPR